MPKVNTLFNYFAKSPPVPVNSKKEEMKSTENNASKTPKHAKLLSPKTSKQTPTPTTKTSPTSSCKDSTFGIGDLVWAKLEGWPWWPSLVCLHPVEKIHVKSTPLPEIHVQFFDDPPSRSWIKSKFVKAYRGGEAYTTPPRCAREWKKACEKADKALEMKQRGRINIEAVFSPSDEENTSMDEGRDKRRNDDSPVLKRQKGEPSIKRRRIVIPSDDSGDDDDFKLDPKVDKSDDDSFSSEVASEDLSEIDDEKVEKSPKSRKRKRNISTPKPSKKKQVSTPTPFLQQSTNKKSNICKETKSKLSNFMADDSLNNISTVEDSESNLVHLTFNFLHDKNIKDAKGRTKSNPEYDCKTLFVPESYRATLTPAHRQWWEMKSQHFDVVLFFKVGKFYELYHMDAVIGVTELGLTYMRGNYAHSGFPEIAYGRYADTLVQKGYKVARIEQTETPLMMEERCKKTHRTTKFDKVVSREICRITTIGTRTCSFIERESLDVHSCYLLAVTEKKSISGTMTNYGVCFIDTSIGKFYLGQFEDDRHGSRFRTLVSHYTPKQLIYEKGKLSIQTQQIITTNLSGILKESLTSKSEFWDSGKTLTFLREGTYFTKSDKKEWPQVLKSMLDESDSLGLDASPDYELAISALGACIWYLSECKLEDELLSLMQFEKYEPIHFTSQKSEKTEFPNKMVLDGITLENLDVLQNSVTGSIDGTLIQVLDHCFTSFGKRLLRQWLCAPLCDISAINNRLDAIEDLLKAKDLINQITENKKLPDLERLLSKIHTQGSASRCKSHPDGRAIFFDAHIYSKRKIESFLTALTGFQIANDIGYLFKKYTTRFKSTLLKKLGGQFPSLTVLLEFFENAFDHKKAKQDGKIVPAKGVDSEYDEAMSLIKSHNEDLDDYLQTQQKLFGCKVTYFGTGKNRFQVEVPDHASGKATNEHELQSQRKGFKRYWTDEIKTLLSKLTAAEDQRNVALEDIMRRIFETFDKDYKKWELAVQCLSVLDVLLSLAEYSRAGQFIRPELVTPSNYPFLEIRNGYHPCISKIFTTDDFIPNDTLIGLEEADSNEVNSNMIIISGPNMGGKSTLMRQVGLIVIMAQMGCYVPAEKCRLTLADRIFTRLGASDRIMSGESTFFVELSETAAILSHSTENSLVLIDELGRGTATYDGTAIASAVVKELSEEIHCRTLFSTHYHTLVQEFSSSQFIKLAHMSCMVENENEDDPTEETITFLYKFIPGSCPKSYGFNAAKLASIPHEVLKNGFCKAKVLEQNLERKRLFRTLVASKPGPGLLGILKQL
uniref:DNA mismatch repair protein n=1 Tax=Strigamia maritima TaxID=126957 RepID=T1IQG1_STRMM